MFAGKKSAQIREILISESTWEEMTCLFAPSLIHTLKGCLGQIGQTELVSYVIDIENRVKMGKIIALEELTDLRQKIRMIFKNYTIT
ncbi:hypothetical protein C3F37_12755 [Salmonella enterica subsp. enterica serovar Senftenberg]|nr:hypothetical protein C3F37_12755 [Salmonella enterica subsp. enterica serovar Senftenberg]QBY71965.1 hypothetical protein EIP71_09290 [Salmonella enterica subsp. enterica serovar Senftenberg]QBY81228.1 hypothetical protein EIO66_09290 [Salmonella enterica subsp. enterica serovar Senftenberg]QCC11769.1 hypothetical protein EIP70_09290 [Salmonella enterica subsp. enterica serovar Senftenberg]